MRTAEGQGEKKIATQLSKGLREKAASVLSPRPRPGSTLYHRRGPPLAPP